MMKPLDLSENAPWKQRFTVPAVRWFQVAKANKTRGLVCANLTGTLQLFAWDTNSGEIEQLTSRPKGTVNGALSSNGRFLYYLADQGGNEVGHFVRQPTDGSSQPVDITPEMPPYASWSIGESQNGRLLGFSTAGQDGFKAFAIEQSETGELSEPRQFWQSPALSFGPQLSFDGDLAVMATTERTQTNSFSLVALNIATGEKIGELFAPDDDFKAVKFEPKAGSSRFLASSSASGYARPLIWHPHTGERQDLPLPELGGEVYAQDWSDNGRFLLLSQLYQAQMQLHLYDLEEDKLIPLDATKGKGTFSSGRFMPNDEIWLNWENASTPPCVIALDQATGDIKRPVLPAGAVPDGRSWQSITFAGGNNDDIQAWVATPEGDGPFPMILHTHGGPTAVMTNRFAPSAQAWLDHGFAFMSVNYHGSVTFGKAFEDSIFGYLGQLEVDDMAAAYQWAVDNGIAKPDEVLLTGGSYGGYLTLQGLGKRPDLWAGGMASVAIADWVLMYEDQAETLRGYQRALFGGSPDEKPEDHAASSPITYAEAVRAPVHIIQGSNDTRCPARQLQVYEKKLQELK